MRLAKIIDIIFEIPEIKEKPPVLIDIGASKFINPIWKIIGQKSIIVALDADKRDIEYIETIRKDYPKLILVNKIIAPKSLINNAQCSLYLTKSPYCSSILKPNIELLQNFHYSDYFEIEEEQKLEAIDLPSLLNEFNIDYIDWFKTDAQGIDLRLFDSLDNKVQNEVIVAEFEPGLLPFYIGEDVLLHIMNYMSKLDFHIGDIDVKGPIRINKNDYNSLYSSKIGEKIAKHVLKKQPGWATIQYYNNLTNRSGARAFYISWLFQSLLKNHPYAYSLAQQASRFSDHGELNRYILNYSKSQLTGLLFKKDTYLSALAVLVDKLLHKN